MFVSRPDYFSRCIRTCPVWATIPWAEKVRDFYLTTRRISMKPTYRSTKGLVTGASGFIGSQLGRFLKEKGYWVRGVDIKTPAYLSTDEICHEFLVLDLRRWENCLQATDGIDEVY